MDAGKLDRRVAFDRPEGVNNGQGGTMMGWHEQHRCWAAMTFLRGGETVMAARLSGKQPVVVTIRTCLAARAIGTNWRLRDVRTGEIYNIRSIVPSNNRAFIELTCESGVAV